MSTSALLVTATVAAAAFASMCHPAQAVRVAWTWTPTAMVSGTCEAAHKADSRVNASFCVTHLRKEPSAIDTDIRGLAGAAARMGLRNADAARSAVGAALRRRDEGDSEQQVSTDPIYRRALERCDLFYGEIGEVYAAVREAIADPRSGPVSDELESVLSLAHSCDSGFALVRPRRAGASPLAQYSEDNTQIAILTVAITSLIRIK